LAYALAHLVFALKMDEAQACSRWLKKRSRCLPYRGNLQGGMAKTPRTDKKPIEQYDHKGKKRINNPPVGLVDAKSDAVEGKKTYAYDSHLDPAGLGGQGGAHELAHRPAGRGSPADQARRKSRHVGSRSSRL
jgi:hypothetical protein